MSAVNAPFGLRPVYHISGMGRAREYSMLAAYATPVYKGSPVTLAANRINLAVTAADWLGVFDGVNYLDSTGKPTLSNFWPGVVTGATAIQAWVWDDPNTVFEIQAAGSIAQALAQGGQIDFEAGATGAGSALTGLSTCRAAAAIVVAPAQGQMRIVDVGQAPDNAWGDAFTVLQVQNARHTYVANKVSV